METQCIILYILHDRVNRMAPILNLIIGKEKQEHSKKNIILGGFIANTKFNSFSLKS